MQLCFDVSKDKRPLRRRLRPRLGLAFGMGIGAFLVASSAFARPSLPDSFWANYDHAQIDLPDSSPADLAEIDATSTYFGDTNGSFSYVDNDNAVVFESPLNSELFLPPSAASMPVFSMALSGFDAALEHSGSASVSAGLSREGVRNVAPSTPPYHFRRNPDWIGGGGWVRGEHFCEDCAEVDVIVSPVPEARVSFLLLLGVATALVIARLRSIFAPCERVYP